MSAEQLPPGWRREPVEAGGTSPHFAKEFDEMGRGGMWTPTPSLLRDLNGGLRRLVRPAHV